VSKEKDYLKWLPVLIVISAVITSWGRQTARLDANDYKMHEMQSRLDRMELRLQRSNDKQDAELKSYWDNLELRIGEIQRMQFDSCKRSKN